MSQDWLGFRQTLFYVEGERKALLVSRVGRRHRERTLKMETAEAALAWCRSHAAGLVYCRPDAERN